MTKEEIKQRLNLVSLRNQLILLSSSIILIIVVIIISYNYIRNKHTIMEENIKSQSTILTFEGANFDSYLSEINWYSLALRNDATFLQMISSNKPLDYEDKSYIQSLLKSNFYSRSDLISYNLYLIKKNALYSRSTKLNQFLSSDFYDFDSLPGYDSFTKGSFYRSIFPSGKGGFMNYYRTIIDIETKEPLAVVELSFTTTFVDALAKNHIQNNEIYCILDGNNHIYYTSSKQLADDAVLARFTQDLTAAGGSAFTTRVLDVPYLAVSHVCASEDFTLVLLKPVEDIENDIAVTRNVSFVLALIAISFSVLLFVIFIRLVTNPISALTQRMKKAGSGNFAAIEKLGGNLEICELEEEYNTMLQKIDELIKTNYIAKLNEETARLIALEAQTNPHFLYNTLQAISAEAILNNQTKINTMITSLASLLRYSIKEKELVAIEEEIVQVRSYLMLQKERFDSSLSFCITISDEVSHFMIPKLSIMTLVENSILHGIKGNVSSIHIDADAFVEEETLWIKVSDNGNGIEREQLEKLLASFSDIPLRSEKNTGIGLSNLASRLRLIYHEQAALHIESILYAGTVITVSIPILEVQHVSGIDH
ncbi:MAG: histidine kinase [Lachnospiraceae bacterium]